MAQILTRMPAVFLIAFIVASCITINIYFPAAAVEKAADRIVEEVWGDKENEMKKQEMENKQGGPQSLLNDSLRLFISVIEPAEAHAQDPDINVTTPSIRALKDSIQSRARDLIPYMDSGNAGLTSDGFLEVRSGEGLGLQDKARLNRLVQAENKDRDALYAEIAKANNFPPERIKDIKTIFAGSWAKNARSGWWIQGGDGSWKQK
jgi:uncharacterized protein YdbL (DUF1318 family)